MKLVRYGAKGAEKPGLIDKSGQLRDLSAHVKDLNGEAYSPASLAKLAALDPSKLPAGPRHCPCCRRRGHVWACTMVTTEAVCSVSSPGRRTGPSLRWCGFRRPSSDAAASAAVIATTGHLETKNE